MNDIYDIQILLDQYRMYVESAHKISAYETKQIDSIYLYFRA